MHRILSAGTADFITKFCSEEINIGMESTKKKNFKITSGRSLSKGQSVKEFSQKSLEPVRTSSGRMVGSQRTPPKSTTTNQGSKRISLDGRQSQHKFLPSIHELDNMDKYLEKHLIEVGKGSHKDVDSLNNEEPAGYLSISQSTPLKTGTKGHRLVKGSTVVLDQPKTRP